VLNERSTYFRASIIIGIFVETSAQRAAIARRRAIRAENSRAPCVREREKERENASRNMGGNGSIIHSCGA